MPTITEPETDRPETVESDTETAEPDEPSAEGDQGEGERQGDDSTAEPLGASALLTA